MDSLRGPGALARHGCALMVFASLLAGCDLAGGFQSASNALVPEQKSYLELGGTRIASGPFHDVRLGIAPRVAAYLTARPGKAGDGGRALSVLDVQAQSACQLADVAAYDADFGRRELPMLAIGYLEASDDSGAGTLRFVDPQCRPLGPSLADASWPPIDASAARGFAVRAAGGLSFVDVVSGEARSLVSSFVSASPIADLRDDGSYAIQWVVRGDGQIVLFDDGWQEQARFGSGVDGLVLPNGYSSVRFDGFYTDADGLHELALYPSTPALDTDNLLERDACQLHADSQTDALLFDLTGVVYRAPCASSALIVRSHGFRYQFAVSADPALTRVVLSPVAMPLLAFLSDVASGTRRGALTLATPTAAEGPQPLEDLTSLYEPLPLGIELPIADGVELDWVQRAGQLLALSGSDGASGTLLGYDVANGRGAASDLVGPSVLAERVLAANEAADTDHTYPDLSYDSILMNAADGVADLASPCSNGCSGYSISAGRVPAHGFLARHEAYFSTNVPARWQALLLTDFDGAGGNLRLADHWRNDASRMPLLASSVAPGKFTLLDLMPLPGAAFISHWDATRGAGRLEYDNVDLGFQQTIHEGVSELVTVLWPQASLLFVVPDGDDAGIWLSLAK